MRRAILLALASAPLFAACAPSQARAGDWNGWSDAAGTRFQSAAAAGLTAATAPKLKLKWAFGYSNATTAFGSPSIVGGTLYVGAADGTFYALDAVTGCTRWTFTASGGIRAAPSIANGMVYIGDLSGNVYAVSASSGTLLWKTRPEQHPKAVVTGSPKLEAGRLYVPVSGRDDSMAAGDPNYECCTFRGSVVALDAATGKRIWQAYTISEEPKVTGKNPKGVKTWGPSGAVPWSSPTIDVAKRAVYIGTGVNYSQPATDSSDAVLAFDMDSGKLLWKRQLTSGDLWNFACTGQDKTNCPKQPFIDVDFGNSGILRSLGNGKRILVLADKGGTVYGIDPDRQGALVWKQRIAKGGVNGGFMWGGASDEQGSVYFSISDFTAGKPEAGGGVAALDLATGAKRWLTPAPKPACIGVKGCSAAQPAAVTAIPGVLFAGSWDGHARAYNSKSGAIIWDFDTAHEFSTVNGVKAHGGSINSAGPVAAGGMLYVPSGYGGNGMNGNLLLAFSVDGK